MSFTLVSGSKVENRLSIIQRKKVRYKNEYLTYAERKGFEPSMQLPAYYLSRVAPSTTRTPFYYFRKDKKNIEYSKLFCDFSS